MWKWSRVRKVREVRVSSKQKHASVKVTEDLLNRRIQVYGLVTPERSKNVVLCGPCSRNTLPTMSNGDTSWGFTQDSTWRSGLSISPLALMSKIHETFWPCSTTWSTKMFLSLFRRTPLFRVCSVLLRGGTTCWPVKLKTIWTWCQFTNLLRED
jgi:hypothetical protein